MTERLYFYDEIQKNKLKSLILIIIIFIFFITLCYIISLVVNPKSFFLIMIFAIIFSLTYVLVSYYNSDKIVLASVNARPASKTENRMLFNSVESMSLASGLPMPKVYIMESEQINAFASGRDPNNAVICVTTGMLRKLDKQELEGVIAHEMSHIANCDIRFMTLVAVLVGMVSIIAQIFLRNLHFASSNDDRRGKVNIALFALAVFAAILAPIATRLVSLAISRKREFTADATGVKFTRYPSGLKSALEKIKEEHVSERDLKLYPAAVAPLFIGDPYKKKIQTLFSTHPPIDERIRRLERM